jgi:ubiquitin carboxyl-terminal hydrolase 4/11/15
VLQNIFDIGYFTGSVGTFPTGWSDLSEDQIYPSISSRLPRSQQDEDAESGNEVGSTRTGSESSVEDDEPQSNGVSNMTRMTEESSDEDAILPPQRRVSAISLSPMWHIFPLNYLRAFLYQKTLDLTHTRTSLFER